MPLEDDSATLRRWRECSMIPNGQQTPARVAAHGALQVSGRSSGLPACCSCVSAAIWISYPRKHVLAGVALH